jgi:dTDP-6-deoxy-L-talose 4-dehydrogenase (NAD+)
MKIAVIGGTGFIGNHLVRAMLKKGIKVLVTGTNLMKAQEYDWYNQVDFMELNINEYTNQTKLFKIVECNKIIHLAWKGLPNYKDLFHFEEELLVQYNFIKSLVVLGMKDITITGTCFEYGMKEGALSADTPTDPQNPYALAKDSLRKFLTQLQTKYEFQLKWLRLFYMYGPGQSEKSILSQLDKALKNGEQFFNMSGGEQLRDYLEINELVEMLINAMVEKQNGVYNICSGIPISIKQFVQDYLVKNKQNIKLNLGFYSYPDYEPMNFWGIK